MAKWTIRNYNAAIREIRAKTGSGIVDARATYRNLSAKLHRPVYGVDIQRHPRLLSRSSKETARQRREESAERKAIQTEGKLTRIRRVKDWEDYYDEAIDFEPPDEYGAGVDTGRSKK